MKRAERHHLKENELERLALHARETMDARRRELTIAMAVVALIGAVAIGYVVWNQRVEGRAHGLLAEALIVEEARIGPPAAPGTVDPTPSFPTERERAQAAVAKFKLVADSYPDSDAGIFARYKEAAINMTLGSADQAAAAYQSVIDRDADGVYGQMARLGLAEAQARGGQYDQAINAFMELSQLKDGPLPIDAILMELGRTYVQAGKPTEAEQTFTRLIEEYPDSPFNEAAKRQLEALKKTA
jgi:TolA-binding protein